MARVRRTKRPRLTRPPAAVALVAATAIAGGLGCGPRRDRPVPPQVAPQPPDGVVPPQAPPVPEPDAGVAPAPSAALAEPLEEPLADGPARAR